jgi:hypothetical protein
MEGIGYILGVHVDNPMVGIGYILGSCSHPMVGIGYILGFMFTVLW